MVWSDLVDAVHHACSRFLGGWAFQMGLPTTWKGDGRVTDRRLSRILEPLECSIPLDTVFCIGRLKPAYLQRYVVSYMRKHMAGVSWPSARGLNRLAMPTVVYPWSLLSVAIGLLRVCTEQGKRLGSGD